MAQASPEPRSWAEWVELCAWSYLRSHKPNLGGRDDPRQVLGDQLPAWLIAQARWREWALASAWGSRSPEAGRFVIRSMETWPDESILADLKTECGENGLAFPHIHRAHQRDVPPPPRDGRVDLLAWWLLRHRGMRSSSKSERQTLREHPVYGPLVYTRFGYPIFFALRNVALAMKDGSGCCPSEVEAMRRIFEFSWDLADAYFYRDGWQILNVAEKYDLAKEAWGLLHTCIANYVCVEMLKRPDKVELERERLRREDGLDVPGLHIEDLFRRMLKQAKAERGVEGSTSEDDRRPVFDLHAFLESRDVWRAAEAGDGGTGTDLLIGVLASFSPEAKAAFLLGHLAPESWTDNLVATLAREVEADPEVLSAFILKRAERVDKLWRQTEACEEKVEYLSALIAKTKRNLKDALVRQASTPEAADRRIQSWEEQAARDIKQQDLPKVPRGCSADSVEFLAPWLQDLAWRRKKLKRYAEQFGHDRFEFSKEEKEILTRMLSCSERRIDESVRTVRRAIEDAIEARNNEGAHT